MPEGARPIGGRVKPIIRLGMGFKDPERGFPRKTDHFTVRGDERAVAKFKKTYGEKPKAVKIMVPSSLSLALDISYRAFVGGQSEDGGRPLALGMTNFAPLGYAGGPDVLRIWGRDGNYHELETKGLDELGKPLDDTAAEYEIALYTTFTFTIPDVLGWGSFAQITSKGKKTADNLVFKLSEIYSAFGSKAPWAFDRDEPPQLVLKPDTALMRMEKDGEAKWAKSKIFVLDIVIPEAFDKMLDRLADRRREIDGQGGPAAVLYGTARELPPASPSREVADGGEAPVTAGATSPPEEAAASGGTDGAAASSPEPEPEPVLGKPTEFKAPESVEKTPEVLAAEQAATVVIPQGENKGRPLKDLTEQGDKGVRWIRWCLRQWADDAFGRAAWDFARIYFPEVYEQVREEKGRAE